MPPERNKQQDGNRHGAEVGQRSGPYNAFRSGQTVQQKHEGNVQSSFAKQGEERALDLFLNEETSRYIFRILALKQVFAAPAEYGFVLKANQLYQPIKTRSVEVDTTIENLAEWAQQQGTTYLQLKEFNPWLRARSMPDKSRKKYVIQIPIEQDMYYTPARKYKAYRKEWVVK